MFNTLIIWSLTSNRAHFLAKGVGSVDEGNAVRVKVRGESGSYLCLGQLPDGHPRHGYVPASRIQTSRIQTDTWGHLWARNTSCSQRATYRIVGNKKLKITTPQTVTAHMTTHVTPTTNITHTTVTQTISTGRGSKHCRDFSIADRRGKRRKLD